MSNKRNLEEKIMLRISLKKDKVLLRDDFKDLGDYDQVGRALRMLVRQEKIARIGYGLYAKMENQFSVIRKFFVRLYLN